MTVDGPHGMVLWLTGLPASGKTTLASQAFTVLRAKGLKVEHLDGDELRKTLSEGLGFSREDRDKHILRVGYLCQILSRNGVISIVSAISPYRQTRDQVRKSVQKFMEVYLKCPLEICEMRDAKGLYKKARAGKIAHVTGIDDPYEEPLNPELVLETDQETPALCVERILGKFESMTAETPGAYNPQEEKELMEKLSSLGYLE